MAALEICAWAIKSSKHLSDWWDHSLLSFALCLVFLHAFPLFQAQKTHQSFLILLSSPKEHKILFSYSIFFSLVPHFGFGVYGCGCSFLANIHTPNLLNLFLAFILLCFAWITWFITFFIMFLVLFVFLA